jgi:hypothetical protein
MCTASVEAGCPISNSTILIPQTNMYWVWEEEDEKLSSWQSLYNTKYKNVISVQEGNDDAHFISEGAETYSHIPENLILR